MGRNTLLGSYFSAWDSFMSRSVFRKEKGAAGSGSPMEKITKHLVLRKCHICGIFKSLKKTTTHPQCLQTVRAGIMVVVRFCTVHGMFDSQWSQSVKSELTSSYQCEVLKSSFFNSKQLFMPLYNLLRYSRGNYVLHYGRFTLSLDCCTYLMITIWFIFP